MIQAEPEETLGASSDAVRSKLCLCALPES